MAGVNVRVIPTDDQFHLRAFALKSAIAEDVANGKIPFFVCPLIIHIINSLKLYIGIHALR